MRDLNYNKQLRPFANRLRKNMTKAESALWKYVLRARQMQGFQFNRQRPVLNYIADFMCKELKLVIEIDGYTHLFPETAEKDDIKTENLTQAGFRVLRFSDSDVLNDIDLVAEEISKTVTELST